MIRPWIFEFVNLVQQAGEADRGVYDWHLDLWAGAEASGFEGVFFSEHHFSPAILSPSPNILIAALAMRTTTLRLGVMGQVLPLNAPWRVAEEMGMLDQLSHGRLEVGYSSGAGPMESRKVGIPAEEVKPRYLEALDLVEKALREPSLTHHGRFWNVDDLKIVPRVVQQPVPPRWITVLGEASTRDAARRGCKVCTGFIPVAGMKALFDAYRDEAPAATPADMAIRRQVFVAPTDAQAHDLGDAANALARGRMRARGSPEPAGVSVVSGAPDAPNNDDGLGLYFDPEESIIGSPASVAEQIIDQCRRTGAGHILAYNSSALARADVARSYALWADVIPILRKADIA